MKKAIYKLNVDCGRMGNLEGIFIATIEQVNKLISSEIGVYFGEVLGKHSEIFGSIGNEDIELLTDNEEAVRVVEDYGLSNGYNPFDYTSINFEADFDTDDMTVGEIIDKLLEK